MAAPGSFWTCCGFSPFGRVGCRYRPLPDPLNECPTHWRTEIAMGLPPGVDMGDVKQAEMCTAALRQTYLLAVQSNKITEYLRRFDAARVPAGCQETVRIQISKLKSIQNVIWNAMLSLAIGDITVDESAFHALLNKRADETVSLLEMEKLATTIASDDSVTWAAEINNVLVDTEASSNPSHPVIRQPTPQLAVADNIVPDKIIQDAQADG
ncbi:JM93 [macacine gammaherpesvirus 11]|uniref:JM93 n=2 Tax=macacine gammaherpesvirus 11 TaxID=2560570 RepID=G9JMS1_9GAMA|nr:JM93 [Macaca fuscata rhadinovirus]AAT00070.1 JM93 [Macaca fuscata rhadinovirus]AEW87618.1 JM93 [Macaca fuscata rhadinovirus]AEW87788.1 JM93 [Macaca fuscata rhadinovirus]